MYEVGLNIIMKERIYPEGTRAFVVIPYEVAPIENI